MVFIFSVILFSFIFLHTGSCCEGGLCEVPAFKKVSIVADILENTANGTSEINIKDLFWHVSILHQTSEGGGLHFLCSGSLVRHSLVVTAAGCVARANLTRLRAAVGLTRMQRPLNPDEAEDGVAVYNVSEKYYPYRDNYTFERDDLAILRLSNVTASESDSSLRLAVFPATARLSKHCFTVGWGLNYEANRMVETCSKPGYRNSLWVSLYQSKYSQLTLKNILQNFHNILGYTKSIAFGVSNMLAMFQNSTISELPQFSEEPTCSRDDSSPLRAVKMSASGKLRNVTMCANSSAICLQAKDAANDLIHKVDIGSPIFCKIKKPKAGKNCPQPNSSVSQFVLAGVVTSKKVKDYPLAKRNVTISVIRATNVTRYSHFVLSVLNRKN